MEMESIMEIAIQAAYMAGLEILEVYNTDFDVDQKSDNTPITLADRKAHNKIVEMLKPVSLPILSEEGRAIPYGERKSWKQFWMVDPLDGTKEFVKRNGEFTVNIALIDSGNPKAGIIYVPVTGAMYFGWEGSNAYKIDSYTHEAPSLEDLKKAAVVLPSCIGTRPFTIIGSRSHRSPESETYMQALKNEHKNVEIISMGSSLKICLVAEGAADQYPRFAPTMEWDTAAGHGIANAAGKDIYDQKTGKPMVYNKESLLNNWFVVK